MKNVIISALCAYIFYGFCEVRSVLVPIITFLLVWFICAGIDEEIEDFKRSVRRGQRLNNRINTMKGVER